jgi:hypothetical protein
MKNEREKLQFEREKLQFRLEIAKAMGNMEEMQEVMEEAKML